MSTINKTTDTTLVNRAGVDYRITLDKMSTLQDTDLLLVNRAGVDYRCTAKDAKAALGGGSTLGVTGAVGLRNSSGNLITDWDVSYATTRQTYPDWIVYSDRDSGSISFAENTGKPSLATTKGAIPVSPNMRPNPDSGMSVTVAPNNVFVFGRHSTGSGGFGTSYAVEAFVYPTAEFVAQCKTRALANPASGITTRVASGLNRQNPAAWYDDVDKAVYAFFKDDNGYSSAAFDSNTGTMKGFSSTITWTANELIIGIDSVGGFIYTSRGRKLNYRTGAQVRGATVFAPPIDNYSLSGATFPFTAYPDTKGNIANLDTTAAVATGILGAETSTPVFEVGTSLTYSGGTGWWRSPTGFGVAKNLGEFGSIRVVAGPPRLVNDQAETAKWAIAGTDAPAKLVIFTTD